MSSTESPASPLDVLRAGCAQEPVRLGPFLVGADGLLRPVDAGSPSAFSVRWRGCLLRARLEAPETGSQGMLSIATALGRVPSTASGNAAGLREQIFDMTRALPRFVPSSWRVRLLPDHRIGLEAKIPLAVPLGASELLVRLTSFLLAVAAYFELMEEAGGGLAPSSAGEAGMAKTCPG